MTLKMCNLLDSEKYLLLEIVYFHLPPAFKFNITKESTMKLDVYIDLIDQCDCSFFPKFLNRTAWGRKFIKERQAYFRKIYALSENLSDIVITGYINDNYGPLGNTDDPWKTSFVALAFADSENNGAISLSGCELLLFSSVILDWSGCFTSSCGVITKHHQKALNFYDEYMQDITGERNILGHSKGGNLATYIFINRLNDHSNAYCINAQPYCWFAMDDRQKESLKSDRFEYIIHTYDPTKISGYVPYVSRIAPLSRYAAKYNILNIHGFAKVNFDEFGNLEGTRIIRETTNKLKSRIFSDYSAEKRISHEEFMERFQLQISSTLSIPRLFSITMDEILMVTDALAAIIWLKDEDKEGEYIYPLIFKSPVVEGLYKLKLRKGQGVASRCVFDGLPLYICDSKKYGVHFEGINHAVGITITSDIAVPLGIDEKEIFGALELLNKKNGVFTVEDFALVNDMTLAMLDIFKKMDHPIDSFRDFTLLQIRKGKEKLFSIEKHEYREMLFPSEKEKDAFIKMILGETLQPDESLTFNRRNFNSSMKTELKNLRKREYGLILTHGKHRNENKSVLAILKKHSSRFMDKETWATEVAKKAGLQAKLKLPAKNLTDAEYISLEYAAIQTKAPMLIIVNTPYDGLDTADYEEICNKVKQDCLNKTITAIVLRLSDDCDLT